MLAILRTTQVQSASLVALRSYVTVPSLPYRYVIANGSWIKVDWGSEKILYDAVVPKEGEAQAVPPTAEVTAAVGGEVAKKSDHIPNREYAKLSGQPEHLQKGRLVTIYQPARNPNQMFTYYGREKWRAEWDALKSWKNPLMGWDSTFHDAYGRHHMVFESKEDAIEFAQQEGWNYKVVEPKIPEVTADMKKNYATNFLYEPPKKEAWFDLVLSEDFSGASKMIKSAHDEVRGRPARWYSDLIAEFKQKHGSSSSVAYPVVDVPWKRYASFGEKSEWLARKRYGSPNQV